MTILQFTLSQILEDIPGASAVFNRHQLDICGGDSITLAEAITRDNLDEQALLNDLLALCERQQAGHDWHQASKAELIEHLLSRYHQVHREQLVELQRMAERVEMVHADNPNCPRGLASHLQMMAAELEQHMQKEEQILFPMLAQGQIQFAAGPIHVMRHEHDEHAAAIDKIAALTDGITPPYGACNTWRTLYLELDSFINDLTRHIELENNILFVTPAQQEQAHG